MPRSTLLLPLAGLMLADGACGFGFEQFFGQQEQQVRRGRSGKPRGDDMQVELGVELADVYNGAHRSAQITGKRKVCDDCRGTGAEGGKVKRCRQCRGQGQVSKPVRMGPMMVQMQQPCDTCGGKGVVYKSPCRTCGGTGIVDDDKALDVHIEPGMLSGDIITFENEGNVEDPDYDPGDLMFQINVDESRSKFKRQTVDLTDDLKIVEHITLKEALLGFEHSITHLDNHQLSFGSRGVTQPYQVVRIAGEGMPLRHAPGHHGDLLVEHRVRYPKKVTKKQKEILISAFGNWPRPKSETLICAAPPCTLD